MIEDTGTRQREKWRNTRYVSPCPIHRDSIKNISMRGEFQSHFEDITSSETFAL